MLVEVHGRVGVDAKRGCVDHRPDPNGRVPWLSSDLYLGDVVSQEPGKWSRKAFLAGIAAVSVSIGIGVASIERVSNHPGPEAPSVTRTSVSTEIQVHVAGWVGSPGVVRLAEGSIVAQAVEAAGGLLPEASADSINLAAKVTDGDQIFVPGPGTDAQAPQQDGRVAVNRASASELESLPGVGPVLAERIVAFRDEHGPFEVVEDLLDVPGIGEAKLSSLRDLVRIP